MIIIKESRRLVWLVSALLAFGFLATTLLSYFVSKSTVREAIMSRELPLTSDNIYSEIQRDLLRPIFISSLMASDTFLRDWALEGEKDVAAITRYLKEIKEKYGAVTTFFVSDKTRIYYHPTGAWKTVREEDWRDEWYFRVRKLTEPYELNVDMDFVNRNRMTIFINYRVFDYSGNFIGATGVGLAVDSAVQLIEKYQLRYKSNVFFVDDKGAVTLKGSRISDSLKNIKDDPGYSAIAEAILSSEKGSHTYMKEGQTALVNSRHISELKWRLIVEQVEDPALSTLRKTLYSNLAVCLVITFAVILATSYTVKIYQRKLELMATSDKLTGLLNRQAFDLVYKQEMSQAKREKIPLSLIICDMDRFKEINDTHGHAAGDEALVLVAATIKESLRSSDITCRWGGEEFLILLRDCPAQEALSISEKIRQMVESMSFSFSGQTIPMTLSLGVAELAPDEPLDTFLARADKALYEAKNTGRNRSVLSAWQTAFQ